MNRLKDFQSPSEKDAEPQLNPPISPLTPIVGQWVVVRSLQAIASSLDSKGRLDGLPFMPEMIPHCGKRFRVKRFANKTCVNGESNYIGALEDCVILQSRHRCDGSEHGGCEMGCQFIWKTQWLLAAPEVGAELSELAPTNLEQQDSLILWLSEIAFVDPERKKYQCQQTELVQIAKPIGPLKLKQYVNDNRRNKISIFAIGSFLFSLVAKKIFRRSDNLKGPNPKGTPTQSLGLELGQRVRVKTLEQIRETLDVNGQNRGLWFDPKEMSVFCGKEMVVSRKITRMVDEETGELRIIKTPTVVLSEAECSGVYRRFCSRGMLHFWREIWLEKVDS